MAAGPDAGVPVQPLQGDAAGGTGPQVSTAISIFIRRRYFKAARLYGENNFSIMHITIAS
jgi:hypothetical protein